MELSKMKTRAMVLVAGLALAGTLVGCASESNERDMKREMDRVAIDLTRAEKQRDEYKTQTEKLQARILELEKSAQQNRQELADTQSELNKARTELATVRRQLRQAEALAGQANLPTSRPAAP
jgi:septal ring factor EnvC (AmiA/AmiB activator)